MHPKNPFCPTMHFNYRYFETDVECGGLASYLDLEDMKHFHGTYKTIISNFTKDLREQWTLINESVMKRNYIHKRFQKKGFEPTRIRFVMRNQNQWATFQKHFFDILKLKYNEIIIFA